MLRLVRGTYGAAVAAALAASAVRAGEGAGASTRREPAILFAGYPHFHCGFEMAGRLRKDGFALNAMSHPGLEGPALEWDFVRRYNAIVLTGLGMSNADLTLSERNRATIQVLRRFLDEGGGIFVIPTWCQMETQLPPQRELLGGLGLEPLFDEVVFDPETSVRATAWKLDFARTDRILAASPIAAGVGSLWYPVATRSGAQQHTTTFRPGPEWTIVARGSGTSFSRRMPFDQWCRLDETQPGVHERDVPLVACREVGKGRAVCFAVTPEYVFSNVASTTLEGIVMDRGLRGAPSHGYALVRNALRWLAEPSVKSGALGGAAMDEHLLNNPSMTQFGEPFAWPPDAKPPDVKPPEAPPALAGVIGARTARSSGRGTVAEWVRAAKRAGLSYLVFLEEFARLSKDEFEALKADCARETGPGFAAVPGFTIDDEVGNHYFYFGTSFPYPDPKFLTGDGRRFASYDAEIDPKAPRLKGQLAMTTLGYAYSIASFRLTAGNYLFGSDAAPFADFFSNWDAAAVVTCADGRPMEDATADYLKLADSGQGPLPVAIDLMTSPARLATSPWRTVLRLAPGEQVIGGRLEGPNPVAAYWDVWHHYPDNPTRIYVTSGPEIAEWSYAGPRDYEGNAKGDFVWQNLRWRVRGEVKSAAPLREVVVLDGEEPLRRFLPAGAREFSFTLDLNHDEQHNLVLVATDSGGRRAVSGEQWDRNHRMEEFMCGDRNNQLSYGYLTRADGRGLLIGGNQSLGTPFKRIDPKEISPSGTFRNDALLGAPAFDGAAGGEPCFFSPVIIKGERGEVAPPSVSEAVRLLHTADVHIGEGRWEHDFADGVRVANVWHTLWRTVPARDFTAVKRNHFFNVDPESPLAVYLWRIRVELLRDCPNSGLLAGFIRTGEAGLWALRGSDGSCRAGRWEDEERSERRTLTVPFGPGAYAAALDSPLGGMAVFPMSEGLEAEVALPARAHGNIRLHLAAANTPKTAGGTAEVAFLLVGIPRATAFTKRLPAATTEVVERFHRDFCLDGGPGGYAVEARAGRVLGRRYVLDVDGAEEKCFSGTLSGDLVSSLPVTVSNLNDRWSAFLYDRGVGRGRPVGMFDRKAWATVALHGKLDVFVGHPVTCDRDELTLCVAQQGEAAWRLEVHNPTDRPARTRLRLNPSFDPFQGKEPPRGPVEVPAGASVFIDL